MDNEMKAKVDGILKANSMRELNKVEMAKVSGGDAAKAEAWLKEYMNYYGLTNRDQAFARMTVEEKNMYNYILNEASDWENYSELLNK